MKKILFSLVCFLAALQLSAQQPSLNVVNPGFEQWTSGHPTGWTTHIAGHVNISMGLINYPFPVSLNFGTQTTDAHSGDFALKLTANGIDLSSAGLFEFSLPGIAQLGTAGEFSVSMSTIQQLIGIDPSNLDLDDLQNINWNELASLRNVLSTGDTFTAVPSAMKVWVKYLPPAGMTDTMMILVGAYKTGEPNMLLMGELPTSYGYYVGTERIENYTELTVPISYDVEDLVCDSLMIMFVSSPFMNANSSTEMYIDDISFEFDYMSVESTERIRMSLYPNPASDYLLVSIENQTDLYDLTVYDVNGRQVKKLEHLIGETRMVVNELSAGTYFLKVQQKGNTTVRKFVVE